MQKKLLSDKSNGLLSLLNTFKLCFCLICLLVLSACSATIKTKVNTFRLSQGPLGSGIISVIDKNSESPSLEYAFYQSQLETALKTVGYRIATSEQKPEYIAFLEYSVKEVKSKRSSMHTGFVVPSLFYSSRLGADIVIVDDGRQYPVFERSLQLVIALNDESKTRLYEVKGLSRGRCEIMSQVFDEMLEAIMTGFPAENGSLKTVSVRGDADC